MGRACRDVLMIAQIVKIFPFLWKPKVNHSVDKNLTMNRTLNQLNSIHIITAKIYFPPVYVTVSSSRIVPAEFPTKILQARPVTAICTTCIEPVERNNKLNPTSRTRGFEFRRKKVQTWGPAIIVSFGSPSKARWYRASI